MPRDPFFIDMTIVMTAGNREGEAAHISEKINEKIPIRLDFCGRIEISTDSLFCMVGSYQLNYPNGTGFMPFKLPNLHR